MEIEIKTTSEVIEKINIDLPYYYKQDISDEYNSNIIYGKIEENKVTTINIKQGYMNEKYSFEVESENFNSIKNSGYSCYFKEKYKSSKDKFNSSLLEIRAFISVIDIENIKA